MDDHCRRSSAYCKRAGRAKSTTSGARNERRNLEVVESILKAVGKPASLIRFVKDRPDMTGVTRLIPRRSKGMVGVPETWESGLKKTIAGTRKMMSGSNVPAAATGNITPASMAYLVGAMNPAKHSSEVLQRGDLPS